jgi:hypothetical protein
MVYLHHKPPFLKHISFPSPSIIR